MLKFNMTMMKKLYSLAILALSFLIVSCSEENRLLDHDEMGSVDFTIEGKTNTRATSTVLSQEEAKEFWITIFKGTDLTREWTQLKNLDTRLYVGYGYTATVENCDETHAITTNEGWGQRRYTGQSAPFAIKAGEITKVGISCSVANTGVEVVFDESVPKYFTTSYKVTVADSDRSLLFDSTTGGSIISGKETSGKTGYFNVSNDGTHTINYTIEAYGANLRLIKTSSVTLNKAKISRLKFTFVPGTFELDVDVNNEDMLVEQNIKITQDDVIQDDGSADMDSNHDSFNESDEDVDINDYN